MPLVHDGAERCALQPGTYTVGGHGADALPITRLECCPAVATIVVPADGPPTIQRLTARVVVFLDRTPLGIAAKELSDGAQIEFGDCCLTFSDDSGPAITAPSTRREQVSWSGPARPIAPPEPTASASRARIVNVRTSESIDLGPRRVTVGRDESCDLVLHGMHVSRRHFSVAPVEGGYLLRDESANGTIVNGSCIVGTYLLGPGDVLRLDEDELRFEIDGVAPPAATDVAAPTALLDLSYVRAAAGSDAAAHPSPPEATLEIVRGHFAGASFAIDRPVCAIGRGPHCDVRIRDDSVSTAHATLLRKGTSWYVVDLRSSNGTFVNGSRVAGERELASGARLQLGAVELMFRALNADAEETPVRERSMRGLSRLFRWRRGQAPHA